MLPLYAVSSVTRAVGAGLAHHIADDDPLACIPDRGQFTLHYISQPS